MSSLSHAWRSVTRRPRVSTMLRLGDEISQLRRTRRGADAGVPHLFHHRPHQPGSLYFPSIPPRWNDGSPSSGGRGGRSGVRKVGWSRRKKQGGGGGTQLHLQQGLHVGHEGPDGQTSTLTPPCARLHLFRPGLPSWGSSSASRTELLGHSLVRSQLTTALAGERWEERRGGSRLYPFSSHSPCSSNYSRRRARAHPASQPQL